MRFLATISFCISVAVTACGGELSADEVEDPGAQKVENTSSQTRQPRNDKFILYETNQEALSVRQIKPVTLVAAPFKISDDSQTYATMRFICDLHKNKKSILAELSQGELPSEINANGRFIPPLDKVNMLPRNDYWFWQTHLFFFDENHIDFPPFYTLVEESFENEFVAVETQVTAIPFSKDKIIRDAIFPKIKVSKTMRLESEYGTGPTFDLTNIKSDIERLEAGCTPKDATNAK